MATKNIIFLDIDGVLLPFGSLLKEEGDEEDINQLFPKSTLNALAYIVINCSPCQIVLSSTWRVQPRYIRSIETAFHKHPGLEQVKIDDITDPQLHSERQYEIHEWLLQRHSPLAAAAATIYSWIALDDEELLLGPANARLRPIFEGHVIRTESHVGLTMNDAQEAVRLLQAQQTATTK